MQQANKEEAIVYIGVFKQLSYNFALLYIASAKKTNLKKTLTFTGGIAILLQCPAAGI